MWKLRVRNDPGQESEEDPFKVKTGPDRNKTDLDGGTGEDHRGGRQEKKARRRAAGPPKGAKGVLGDP